MRPSQQDIVELLGLRPHPTCGMVCESYRSSLQLPGDALPPAYNGSRPLGNVLTFMVTPTARVHLHRLRSDQMYHHYLGDPLEVLLLDADGRSEVRTLGNDLVAGQRPQLLLPGGTFHAARVAGGGEYALLATSVWLRAEPEDVELGDPEELAARYPAARQLIAEFSR
ncbi:MAG: cupin domain-containing protein [Planctomycetaceae bacterium]|nr:cupin domain-containing protein [Planctomycetaceae bacterium]